MIKKIIVGAVVTMMMFIACNKETTLDADGDVSSSSTDSSVSSSTSSTSSSSTSSTSSTSSSSSSVASSTGPVTNVIESFDDASRFTIVPDYGGVFVNYTNVADYTLNSITLVSGVVSGAVQFDFDTTAAWKSCGLRANDTYLLGISNIQNFESFKIRVKSSTANVNQVGIWFSQHNDAAEWAWEHTSTLTGSFQEFTITSNDFVPVDWNGDGYGVTNKDFSDIYEFVIYFGSSTGALMNARIELDDLRVVTVN